MRPFRFGVVAAPQGAERWVADVKRIADLGYSTVLMPDGVQLLSPFSSLAVAATVAPVRVGTFVLASPLRTPRQEIISTIVANVEAMQPEADRQDFKGMVLGILRFTWPCRE